MNLETEVSSELWSAVRRSYESQAWSNAILDATHHLSDVIRQRSGLQSDGTALAGQAFGGKAPKLKLNRLQTESEQNVQSGVEQLLRGFYQAIRNPRSHERVQDQQNDADALIVFVNYLLKMIGHARAAFSIDEAVSRILDNNFVPNDRYAQLIVTDIPVKHRLQVALTAFQRKAEAKCENLRYFFNAILETLSQEDREEFFRIVSSELANTNDDSVLRQVLQLMAPGDWLQLTEMSRLRCENWLINNAAAGQLDEKNSKCLSGALATWAWDFLPYFTLKNEAFRALVMKLESDDRHGQDYVLRYFFRHLDHLAAIPPFRFQYLLCKKLNAGDVRFKKALDASSLWKGASWDSELLEAISTFQEAEAASEFDDDIPF